MEDVKMPEAQTSAAPADPPSINTLDGWIENLMACKQLSETDVTRLCEKVCRHICGRSSMSGWIAGQWLIVFD